MQNKKVEFSNSVIKDRILILEDTKENLIFKTFLAPGGGQNDLHYHSKLYEEFKIIKGELKVVLDKEEKTFVTGDKQIIEPFTNHKFYNNSKSEVVFEVKISKPGQMKKALQIMYGLVEDDKATKKGLPKNLFHIAIGIHLMDAFSPKCPFLLQKAGIKLLVFIAKLLKIDKKLFAKY